MPNPPADAIRHSDFDLIIFAISLFLLPLYIALKTPFGRESWNFWVIGLGTVLWIYLSISYAKNQWTHHGKFVVHALVAALAVLALINYGAWQRGILDFSMSLTACSGMFLLISRIKIRHGIVLPLVIICMTGVFYSVWAIGQFAQQADFGLFRIGETRLGSDAAGIAKFMTPFGKVIRAYGPFPHANSLSGSLVIAFMSGLILLTLKRMRPVVYLLAVIALAILVTFSRAGWFSLGMAFAVAALVIAGKRSNSSILSAKRLVLPIAVSLLVFSPLVWHRISDAEDKGISERVSGLEAAQIIIRENGLWNGTGITKYVHAYEQLLVTRGVPYFEWQLSPLHSAPLLVIAEIGIARAAILGCLALWLLIKKRGAAWLWWLPLGPVLLFDHYFLTQTAPLSLLLLYLLLLDPRHFPARLPEWVGAKPDQHRLR